MANKKDSNQFLLLKPNECIRMLYNVKKIYPRPGSGSYFPLLWWILSCPVRTFDAKLRMSKRHFAVTYNPSIYPVHRENPNPIESKNSNKNFHIDFIPPIHFSAQILKARHKVLRENTGLFSRPSFNSSWEGF